MLVLKRKIGETVQITSEIEVRVLAVHGSTVRLGFIAPPEVRIWRKESGEGPEDVPREPAA